MAEHRAVVPGFDHIAIAFGDAEDFSGDSVDLYFAIIIFRANLEDAFVGAKIDPVDVADVLEILMSLGKDGLEELLVVDEAVDGAVAGELSLGL